VAVFFELTTDVFKDRFDHIGQSSPTVARAGAPSVRRPLRGMEVKEDTFAVLKVIDMLGREIKLYDSGSTTGRSATYTNFILQQVNEARQEKAQVVETFGDPYIFFYGDAPRYLDCSAILLNSQDFNWQAEFWANYDQYLRGSKCAEIGARVYLFYDDKIVEGYMMQAAAVNESMNPMAVRLDFRMFLTNYRNISMVGDPRFPIRLGVDVDLQSAHSHRLRLPNTDERSRLHLPQSHRGLIHDNVDEWTGPQPVEPAGDDNVQEVEDLIQAAVAEAAKNYSDMNNVDSITDTGLNNANSGYGTGGAAPAKKPKETPPVDPSQCVRIEAEALSGDLLCRKIDGSLVPYPTTAATPSPPPCPENMSCEPPPSPPGSSPPEPPASTSGANSSGSDGGGSTGAFTSASTDGYPGGCQGIGVC
jgi:hypothetical protein